MRIYYFYAPSEHRARHRENDTIAFQLQALYSYKAFSQKKGREVTSFSFVDQVDCFVNTKVKGHYRFQFDHGKDGCQGHHATNYKELCEAEAKFGFVPIKEADYFRLRKLATKLLFRHTNFHKICYGRNEYYYANGTFGGHFYDFSLASFNYHHNRKKEPYEFHVWRLKNLSMPLYDVANTEFVKLFIHKNKPGEEKYDTYKFSIEAANPRFGSCNHQSFNAGVESVFYRKDYQNITQHQYERLRKIARHLIWENHELDIQPLKKKQDYAVTILDV